MAKRQKLDYDMEELTRNLKQSTGRGVDAFFSASSPTNTPVAQTPQVKKPIRKKMSRLSAPQTSNPSATNIQTVDAHPEKMVKEVKKEASKEVKKFTSKLVSNLGDPPINKVGYYLTRKEIDQLDTIIMKLKPILRDRFNRRVTKNDIIRACLVIGINDWEENQLASELVHLLTSK